MTATTLDKEYAGAFFGVINSDLERGVQSIAQDLKFIFLTIPAESDATDTVEVDLYKQGGIKRLLGLKGWSHTTTNSVVVTENSTVVVSNGIATITVEAGTDDDLRCYMLVGV